MEYDEDVKDNKIKCHLSTCIEKDAYHLLKYLAFPDKPISLPYATPEELLLNHVKYANFECHKKQIFIQWFASTTRRLEILSPNCLNKLPTVILVIDFT